MLGSVQISSEDLASPEVRDICESLKTNSIKLLSLRGCKLEDKDFRKLMKAVGRCGTLLQLNLNLGVVSDQSRVTLLADAINQNRSLESLFLHGTQLGDVGLGLLIKSFAHHPSLSCLDLGDCCINDTGIRLLVTLLPPDGAKEGLAELTLSANTSITRAGWSLLFCAIAASSRLKVLNIDYNNIGDYEAGLFSVALAGSRTLHTVDMEGCGITDNGAMVILEMLESYPTPLRELVLAGNNIADSIQDDIENSLKSDEEYYGDSFHKDREEWSPQPTRPILSPKKSSTNSNTAPAMF